MELEIETDLLAGELEMELNEDDAAEGEGQESPRHAASSANKRGGDASVKAGKAGKALAVGGVRKGTKTHARKCKCCNLFFKPESMGAKSPYCLRDKNTIDNLARLAKQQGKSEWFKEMRADPRKLQMVVEVYADLTGGDSQERKKAGLRVGVCMVC